MVFSLTNKMLRSVAFQSSHSKAFSPVQTFLNSLEATKSRSYAVCPDRSSVGQECPFLLMVVQLSGGLMTLSPCCCLWQRDLQASLAVRNFGAPFSFRCGKRKIRDMFPSLWHLGVCCQVFSLLLGKIVMFILRRASYTLVI